MYIIYINKYYIKILYRLAATIEYQRPDLDLLLDPHHTMRAPISLNPPFNFFQGKNIFILEYLSYYNIIIGCSTDLVH